MIPFEHDRTPKASWYEIAFFYGIALIAAGVAVGLVVYYGL
jgi:hypothetical protein